MCGSSPTPPHPSFFPNPHQDRHHQPAKVADRHQPADNHSFFDEVLLFLLRSSLVAPPTPTSLLCSVAEPGRSHGSGTPGCSHDGCACGCALVLEQARTGSRKWLHRCVREREFCTFPQFRAQTCRPEFPLCCSLPSTAESP
jgi:hypothetical protein